MQLSWPAHSDRDFGASHFPIPMRIDAPCRSDGSPLGCNSKRKEEQWAPWLSNEMNRKNHLEKAAQQSIAICISRPW